MSRGPKGSGAPQLMPWAIVNKRAEMGILLGDGTYSGHGTLDTGQEVM